MLKYILMAIVLAIILASAPANAQFDYRSSPIPPKEVYFPNLAKGDIYISTKFRRLYVGTGNNQAKRYGIGVGRDQTFTWFGVETISRKMENPGWTPPEEMLRRRPDLPRHVAGGQTDNPLGPRALYLGNSLYRIHGTNELDTIGTAVSSGCFRMANRDIVELYDLVAVGAKVYVMKE